MICVKEQHIFFLNSASDAKERQDWINKLRSVAEFHTSSIAEVLIKLFLLYLTCSYRDFDH